MLPDTTLGHYRILETLGKGGMGEVYAAEDTKLHRKVALKVLPRSLAVAPDGRRRFEREAQAIAALNHPNIVTIHSVEEAGGVPFLTMELVAGQSLRAIIPEGGLPPETTIRVGTAVADAMAAAHQRGITHRDLKPANVMMTPEGRVKVLDFGLAKLEEAGLHAGSDEPTRMLSGELTGEGRIIGTVAYMSPEQAEGKPVDQRSDIFSLGVMLHEMATGERPFKGDTDISVISAILKDTPSAITDLKPDAPTGLARIVRRCLAKDPTRRYQTATDLRNDLEELKQDLDSGIATRGPASASSGVHAMPAMAPRSRRMWYVVGALALVVVLAAAFAIKWFRPSTVGAENVFTGDRVMRLTDSGAAFLAGLSPDGRYVAHVKADEGPPSLWVRQTATTSDVRIVAPAKLRYDGVTFAPDGNHVYYVAYPSDSGVASLYKVPVLGGVPLRVLEDIDSAISFSPDRSRFAFVRGNVTAGLTDLMIADADGANLRKLATASGAARFQNEAPAWSPDGKTILVPSQQMLGTGAFVSAVDAVSAAMERVPGDWRVLRGLEWMPDGRSFIAYGIDLAGSARSQLWQVSYPSGERRRITNDLNGYVGVSLSADGRTLATVQSELRANVWVITPDSRSRKPDPQAGTAGEEGRQITRGAGRALGAAGLDWLPDGRLVFGGPDQSGYPQIWIAASDGSNITQLTSVRGAAVLPAVSPDGRWIYYQQQALDNLKTTLWRMAPDGSAQTQLTTGGHELAPFVDPSGQWLYYSSRSGSLNRPMKIPAGGGPPTEVGNAPFTAMWVMPDRQRLFGMVWNDQKHRSQSATLDMSSGAIEMLEQFPLSLPRLMPGGREISYLDEREGFANLFAKPISGGPERQLTRFRVRELAGILAYGWSADGRLAVSRGSSTADVVLISSR